MKYITYFFSFLSLLVLHACSLNTKFDDDEYRPVGASTPVNSKTHTLSVAHKVTVEADVYNESGTTRYTRPNIAKSSAKNFNNNKKNSSNIPSKNTINSQSKYISEKEATKSIKKTTNSSGSDKNNIITRTINQIFNSRYGDPGIIVKISKTVHIHCDKPKKPLIHSQITVCEYQFPRHCGAHVFSLIRKNNKQFLMFHDKSYQRNIIDSLSSGPQSAPGLWDKDDYVSSELLTIEQLINNKTTDTTNLGWIMNVSDNEKAQLGRSYFAAINEASKCF